MTLRVLPACLLAAALCSALAVVYSSHVVRELYSKQQSVEYQQWALQEDYSRLLLEHSTLASPHRIISIAQDDLAMQPPQLSVHRLVQFQGGQQR
ncbi:MAG: cell division protein FtsL [Halieaceae bacterium]|jgi:cell division protein FtsL